MIRSKTNQATGALDALSVWGHLQALQGSESQIYYEVRAEWEADRRYVPLVLYPDLFVTDPAGAMNGVPVITAIEWYDDVPQKTASGEDDTVTHRITNPTTIPTDPAQYREIPYLISDGSNAAWCQGVPKWALIVHKNVPAIEGQQLYAVVHFQDTRSNTDVRRMFGTQLATEYFDDTTLTMEGTRGDEWIMDPIAFPEPLTSGGNVTAEPWSRTVGAQLMLKGEAVSDAEACYLWLVRDDSNARGWREFSAAETDKLLISGAKTKTLTLDVRYIDHDLDLRCYGAQRESGAAWTTPFADGNPYYEVHLVLEMSQKIEAHAVQTRGFEQNYDINRLCHYDLKMKYGQRDVPADKQGLFLVTWKAINLKTFAQQTLGTGMSVEFTPSAKGFSFPDGWGVYAIVQTYKTKALGGTVSFNSGSQVRTRTILTTMSNDPLTIWGELLVLQGQTTQVYDEASDSFEADRRYVPLVLNGQFYVNDPQGEMTGTPTISGIEWYDAPPEKTATGADDYVTHRISNPSVIPTDPAQYREIDYLISDGSNAAWCSGVPKWALIVHKNVTAMEAQQIYAVIKFVDTRTNTTVRKLCSIDLATVILTANSLRVEGDHGKEWIMDPLAFPEPLTAGNDITDEPWLRTLGAQLQLSGKDVADAEACYQWVVRDDTAPRGWREFDELEQALLLTTDPKTKTLTLDMRRVRGNIAVRCYGKMRESGEAWSSPWADGKPYYECQLTMEMSQELKIKALMSRGFQLTPAMNAPCHYDLKVMYGQRTVPQNKMGLFRTTWIGTDNRTFQTQTLGTGHSLDFIPAAKGYSFPKGFGVYAEVSVWQCLALVVDATGKYVTLDGTTQTLVECNAYD